MRISFNFSYLRLYFGLIIIGLLFIPIFNFVVDSYNIYPSPKIQGFNAIKPEFAGHMRMAKAIDIDRFHPDGIALGSSRTSAGIDPEHSGWNKSISCCYNLGIHGANIYEIMRYFQHSHKLSPLEQVALGLDFYMFNHYKQNSEDFDESRLSVTSDGMPNSDYRIHDLLPTLISADACLASITTIKKQLNDGKSYLHLLNGQWEWSHNKVRIKKAGGHHKAFINNEKSYISNTWFPEPYNQYSFIDPETKSSTFEYYAILLKTAYRYHIDLRIFISPSHVRQWEALRAEGLWPLFEEWKQKLVEINEQEAARSGESPYPLWDFSGYNSLTTEDVPPDGDSETQMKWYWESSHYKKELGDLVLDRIFDYHHPERIVPDDFGVLLTPKNIIAHLVQIRAKQREYQRLHPEDVAEIEELAKNWQKSLIFD